MRKKKTRFTNTTEYNKLYWDLLKSKKNYEDVDVKQTPQLKKFFKRIYEDKRKILNNKFYN